MSVRVDFSTWQAVTLKDVPTVYVWESLQTAAVQHIIENR